MRKIYIDMDGTIADLYAVPNWLPALRAENTFPYKIAQPIGNMDAINKAIARSDAQIFILSWTSRGGSGRYNYNVARAKRHWIRRFLPAVPPANVIILPYGMPKQLYAENALSILIDDEAENRVEWTKKGGRSYPPNFLLSVLEGTH